jgi:TRAP-type C4-dicarboxylate transport system substrate-binding protein
MPETKTTRQGGNEMQKRIRWLFLALATVTVLSFFAMPSSAADEPTFKLKMADSFPVGHLGYQTAKRLIQQVEKETGGKLKIDYYPAQQMGKLQDMLKLCQHGNVDIAYVPPSFYSGQVPLNTVMILPHWTTSEEGTQIYSRMIEESPELTNEFLKYGVRPLQVATTSQYDVGTVEKPVRAPEDLNGLRLKSSGGIFLTIAKQYGIQPVTIASPETYEATRRGIVDGAIFSYSSVKGYRLDEVLNYHTFGLRMGGFPSVYVINEKVWQKLPEDYQKALKKASFESAEWLSREWDLQQEGLAKKFEQQGMEIYRIPENEKEKWFAPLSGIGQEWVKTMEERGLPAKTVFEAFSRVSQEVSDN